MTGTVRNDDDETLTDPAVCVVVYSTADKVVRVGRDATLDDLTLDASDTFSVELAVPDSATLVEHVDVWADGLVEGVPGEPEGDRNIAVATVSVTSTPTATPTATVTPTP